MKIRGEFIPASRAIRKIVEETGANPVYVWDVAEEEFNIIKGCRCVMDQQQIDLISKIVRDGLS